MKQIKSDRAISLEESARVAGVSIRTASDYVKPGGAWHGFSNKPGKCWKISEVGLQSWLAATLTRSPDQIKEATAA